jgi:glycosyltransferase involved in cell wall biosynthesis
MKVLGSGSSNGIDCDFFSVNENIRASAEKLKAEKSLPADGWVWIFVGRIVKDKGIAELFDAFEKFHQQFPDDRLWLVGEEEPELDPLEKHHREMLHHSSFIHWCGYQKDIRPFLAAAKVLAFPSYREGFPNVPLQAGAMGCMLLLSDINGCNEIVDNMQNGILVPAKDTDTLLEKLLFIRRNPEMRTEMANKIREKIKSSYHQQTLWNILLNEYNIRIKNIQNN